MSQIARLAIPAFFTLVAEPLFLMADSAIVGHLGTRPLAALGAASAVLLTATGVFIFLAYATTAVVAQRSGAGREDEAIAAGFDGAWLALMLSVPVSILMAIFARPLAAAIGGADVAQTAVPYLRVSALGVPAMLLSLAVTGLLRGLQDTRTPLYATTVGFALNAALNAWFVLGLGWGLAGSALGTVIAQWFMVAFMLTAVLRRTRHVPLRFHPAGVFEAARAGVPLLIRTLALRAALLLTTAVAGAMGPTTLAGHQVTSTIFTFLAFALDALAIAAQTLTGNALGRGDDEEICRMTAHFVSLGLKWGAVAGLGLAALAWWLPLIFTSDATVRRAVFAALLVTAVIQPVAGVLFVLDGVLMGAGDGPFLAKAQVIVTLAYVPIVGVVALARDQLVSAGPTGALAAVWVANSCYLALRCGALERRRRSGGYLPAHSA